jgi:polyisoprenoid-binding protein YceI
MQAPSGQTAAPAVQALLTDGTLAGEWVLDRRESSIRLKNRSMWGLAPVNGIFREVSGNGTVSPDGEVSGTVMVAAASIDTKNTRRDTHLRSADFFDSGKYPDITFTADGIRLSGQGAAVTGALTVPGRCPSMPPRPPAATARSGSTPRSTSTGPTSASPGI